MKLMIGENIRKYRKELGLTQEQLAEAVGVTVGAVSKWESGLSNPDIGMLPALADFFGVSVDVLLGYRLETRTASLATRKIGVLLLAKSFEEGQAEAEKALKRFPNDFELVLKSAVLFQMKGMERNDHAALNRSLSLYEHACGLIHQSNDPSVSELELQIAIGEIYMVTGDAERALRHLKKYNACGVSDSAIGLFLAQKDRFDEALPYLCDSLINGVFSLFRTAIGLANCYAGKSDKADPKAAVDILLWMLGILDGLKRPGEPSYLNKACAMLFSGLAQVSAYIGDAEAAKAYLLRASKAAEAFDAAPNFNARGIRFYQGKPRSFGDDFGETALRGVEKLLGADESTAPLLAELWKEIVDEKQ